MPDDMNSDKKDLNGPGSQQGADGNGPDTTGKTVPYERFQKVNDAKKQAEETLTGLVQELVEDIPERFRALVPNIAPAEQIKWIRSAQKSGLFTAKSEPNGPDSKRPGGKQPVDFAGMSPTELISHGLKTAKR